MRGGLRPLHIWRSWAPADYIEDEVVKLCAARGDTNSLAVYFHILNASFRAGGDVPADVEELSALLGFPKRILISGLKVWIDRGKLVSENGRIFHRRVRSEVEEEIAFRESASASGKKGNAIRYRSGVPRVPDPNPIGCASGTRSGGDRPPLPPPNPIPHPTPPPASVPPLSPPEGEYVGIAPVSRRGPKTTATRREFETLSADEDLVATAKIWREVFGGDVSLGVLRAAFKARDAGISAETREKAIRAVGQARENPERFSERSGARWSAENNHKPDWVLRAGTCEALAQDWQEPREVVEYDPVKAYEAKKAARAAERQA